MGSANIGINPTLVPHAGLLFNPQNPLQNLCPDLIENEGHTFGSDLSTADKYALREFLKTL
jgi:hypothetical protein